MRSFRTMMVLTFASGLMLVAPTSGIAQTTVKDELAAANAAFAAKDIPTAIRHTAAACDLGRIEKCELLGEGFAAGDATQKARAAGFFEKSCAGGNATGCNNLAVLYYKGSGVTKDAARAEALFEKACAKGRADSCGGAAQMLYNGDSVAQDKEKAARLFEQACIGGSGMSCNVAGVYYSQGDVFAKDEAHALRLWDKACEAKLATACDAAGLLIERQALDGPPEKTATGKANALSYFKKALAIDPNDKDAKEMVAKFFK